MRVLVLPSLSVLTHRRRRGPTRGGGPWERPPTLQAWSQTGLPWGARPLGLMGTGGDRKDDGLGLSFLAPCPRGPLFSISGNRRGGEEPSENRATLGEVKPTSLACSAPRSWLPGWRLVYAKRLGGGGGGGCGGPGPIVSATPCAHRGHHRSSPATPGEPGRPSAQALAGRRLCGKPGARKQSARTLQPPVKRAHMLRAGFPKVRAGPGSAELLEGPRWRGGPSPAILQTRSPICAACRCLNDYIISCVCSTLLFYGGFSVAVKKKKEKEGKRNIKAAICPRAVAALRQEGGRSPTAGLGAGRPLAQRVGLGVKGEPARWPRCLRCRPP